METNEHTVYLPNVNHWKELWGIDGKTQVEKQEAYKFLMAAAENYTAAARDIVSCRPADLTTESELATIVIAARQVLKYYYTGMRSTIRSNLACLKDPKNYPSANAYKAEKSLHTTLNKKLDLLQIQLEFLDAQPNAVEDSFPNRDVVELVIHTRYLTTPKNDLKEVQKLMTQTHLRSLSNKRGNAGSVDVWEAGLPFVLFICVSHQPQLIVGTSSPKWFQFRTLHQKSREWREQRFANLTTKDYLRTCGGRVQAAFNQMRVVPRRAKLIRKCRGMKHLVTQSEWLSLENSVQQILRESEGPYAFNHSQEGGRAFVATGPDMFSPMARCWKCRFLHLYRVNNKGLPDEMPYQTSFAANNVLSCAEDLCHHFCSEINQATREPFRP